MRKYFDGKDVLILGPEIKKLILQLHEYLTFMEEMINSP